MSNIDDRLTEIGIVLPDPFPPVAYYLACSRLGDALYVGGHGPFDGTRAVIGKVGTDLTLEQGREAARLTALSMLATMRAELGDLDRVRRIVKVFGMVNVGPGFDNTPAVVDGCSDVLVTSSATRVVTRARRSASQHCRSGSRSRSSSSPRSAEAGSMRWRHSLSHVPMSAPSGLPDRRSFLC